MEKTKKWLTPNQFHREYGVPLNRLREWIAERRCPGFRSGNRFYIEADELLRRIAAGDFAGGGQDA